MILTAIQSSVQNAAEKHSGHSRSTRLKIDAEDRLPATRDDNQKAAQNNIVEDGAYVDGDLDADALMGEHDFEGDIIDVHAGDYMNTKET